MSVIQAMYAKPTSKVRINNIFSDSFSVGVGVHQDSVLSPLLFVIVLEALSRAHRTGCPWEMLYADDLVLVSESLDVLLERLCMWKDGLESKGLRVNMSKTKIMFSGPNLGSLRDEGKYPCGVCRKGVGSNSIFCPGCVHWVHKRCSKISGRLKPDLEFRCSRCCGTARPIAGRPCDSISVNEQSVEVVDTFCYFGDTICAGGGCEAATITRVQTAWGKFKELLPLLANRALALPWQDIQLLCERCYALCQRVLAPEKV